MSVRRPPRLAEDLLAKICFEPVEFKNVDTSLLWKEHSEEDKQYSALWNLPRAVMKMWSYKLIADVFDFVLLGLARSRSADVLKVSLS